ncbi:hypothetical protein [Roseateles chitinivorans]|uniref:hypothetical protein n=1 Tax=Roseateles chitinivorans TaxID=2917965 RepID=UPI003D67BE73
MNLTLSDHEAILALVGDIGSQVEGLDQTARELPGLLRNAKLATVREEGDALSELSEALRLAVKLRRPASELLQSGKELATRLHKLHMLVSTARASGTAKGAVALAWKQSTALVANLQRWADIEGALLAEPEELVRLS